VAHAPELAKETEGVFDPTVQVLWDVLAPQLGQGGRPSDDSLKRAIEKVDWRGVSLQSDRISSIGLIGR
jgi:thiamine biosynthesis lipoprotein